MERRANGSPECENDTLGLQDEKREIPLSQLFFFFALFLLPFFFSPQRPRRTDSLRTTHSPQMTNTRVSSRLEVQPLLPDPGPTLHYAASLTIGFNTRSSSGIDNGPTSLQWERSRQLSHKEPSHTEGILASWPLPFKEH